MNYILSLHDKSSIRPKLAGGKGASLQRLLRFGHNVPSGFIVTSKAFGKFIAANDLTRQIRVYLRDIRSPESRSRASNNIQAALMEATIPIPIVEEIEIGLRQLRGRRFAVRSSASVEDSRQHSWAGQFDSFLDVERREIAKYVRKCWASFFNSRAISYRPEAYRRLDALRIAVVVQEMVSSDFAGVIFSIDPTDHQGHRMLLEGIAGSGEGLVSGRKQSFAATLDKQNGRIISDQKDGQPLLSTQQIRLIYQQAILVEREFKHPVDIEWAFTGNRLFLLQARPITAFSGKLK